MNFAGKGNGYENESASGAKAEKIAYVYLLSEGPTGIERNFGTRRSEIDIIMRDGAQLVFIEAHFRQSTLFGGAEASITAKKCQKLKTAAAAYMQIHRLTNSTAARFDAIALTGDLSRWELYSVNWVKNFLAG